MKIITFYSMKGAVRKTAASVNCGLQATRENGTLCFLHGSGVPRFLTGDPLHESPLSRGSFYGVLILPLLLAACAQQGTPAVEQSFSKARVFSAGEEQTHTYRIPALTVTREGTILAFCEGRRQSRSDTGDIDLVLKRSSDSGKTWTPGRVIVEDAENTIGNPCPVIDQDTGTIWLLLTGNPGSLSEKQILASEDEGTRTVWVTKSQDEGATWSAVAEITQDVKPSDWTWYATGPGNGIQLRDGRLVIPCDHAEAGDPSIYSHIIYSDDHGQSWKLGGTVGEDTDESSVVELADGSLMINMRSNKGRNRREIAMSKDGGLTWSQSRFDAALIEPVCQAGFLRLSDELDHLPRGLLFSNPAATERVRMTVRLSYDEGKSWPVSRLVHEGPSAYSSLAILPDGTIGLLYEGGEEHPYESITFARFNIEWLTNGAGQR